jgi:hypothetical protein
VRIGPADAETHYARAALLSGAGEASAAVGEYERAAALRPRDYVLWLELGRAREEAGDVAGTLAALAESTRAAPHYAQPRWQLGNALLRAGRRDEAFAELRRAAESDPRLYPNFVDVVWHATGGDARALAETAAPRSPPESLALARYLVKQGEVAAGVRAASEAGGGISEVGRRALLSDLLAGGRFREAYTLWSAGSGAARCSSGGACIADGGFEGELSFDETGFGWRIARASSAANTTLSLDADAPREGARSLRIDFGGDSTPSEKIISQLVPVEGGTRYRLGFAARTGELVTGGLPFVRVADAGGAPAGGLPPLAESPALPAGTSGGWQDFAMEFTTPRAAGTVTVSLLRRECAISPCPAFGHLWLDGFYIVKQ